MSARDVSRGVKRSLASLFGYRNVSVTVDRYLWMTIKVFVKIKEGQRPTWDEIQPVKDSVRSIVYRILRESGLINEIGSYYDDMGYKHKKVIVDIQKDYKKGIPMSFRGFDEDRIQKAIKIAKISKLTSSS